MLQKRCKIIKKITNSISLQTLKRLEDLTIVNMLKILLTNDDGYKAEGIKVLSEIMCQFGKVMVVAPKRHQSGMSMAVDLGLKPLAYRHLGERDGVDWAYLDGTPASCAKYGLNYNDFLGGKPDVIVSGINHGSNTTTGSCYSGTLGAAMEGALNGIPAIGVSLCDFHQDADFSVVRQFFPEIFTRLMQSPAIHEGITWNINFPKLPAEEIKGVRVGHQGRGHWEKEFTSWNPDFYAKYGMSMESLGRNPDFTLEEGETLYMMTGTYVDDDNTQDADHHLVDQGWITIVPHNLYNTDYAEADRLRKAGFDIDFTADNIR